MATSEGIPSSIDIELLELNDNPYFNGNYIQGIHIPFQSNYLTIYYLLVYTTLCRQSTTLPHKYCCSENHRDDI